MKGFCRNDLHFSLCGLNCELCAMKWDHYCPGCGGGAGNQSCAIARCSLSHQVQYCIDCLEYPCRVYDNCDEYDSFITHCHQRHDFIEMKKIGIEAYHQELTEKKEILTILLEKYNNGRKKGYYMVAVNLLSLEFLRKLLQETEMMPLETEEKIKLISDSMNAEADRLGIVLKLRKKIK